MKNKSTKNLKNFNNFDNSTVKSLNKRHVFEYSNLETFLMISKNKQTFCYNCSEPALFGKINTNFIRCLNCLKKICRYCLRNYSENHLDFKSTDRCKVFKKKNTNYYLKYSFCQNKILGQDFKKYFILNFIFEIITFFIFISYLMKKLNIIRFLGNKILNFSLFRKRFFERIMNFSPFDTCCPKNLSLREKRFILYFFYMICYLIYFVKIIYRIFYFFIWIFISLIIIPFYPILLNIFEI